MTTSPCPDCGDDPLEPEMHSPGCPRIGTCGQIGPPWTEPPFHRYTFGEPGPDEYRFGEEEQHFAALQITTTQQDQESS